MRKYFTTVVNTVELLEAGEIVIVQEGRDEQEEKKPWQSKLQSQQGLALPNPSRSRQSSIIGNDEEDHGQEVSEHEEVC